MAYALENRFPQPPRYYKMLDPGSYQHPGGPGCKLNKAPFLSNTSRITQPGHKIWTHSIYDVDTRPNIPNVTSLKSKCPRFPYEAFSKEDLEKLLCECGIQPECECPVEEEELEYVCQGEVPRCLFKGPPPRSMLLGDTGLSAPSRNDHGFEVSKSGFQRRKFVKVTEECPPFYDARVNEFTKFYHGWKWGKRTSKRFIRSFEKTPGPADYTIVPQPTPEQICYEKNRHLRRKYSKQLRFIEMVQNINIKEGRPGPATYHPEMPKYFKTDHYGIKAERFPTSKYDISPGPAEYTVKRSFDKAEPPKNPCLARLPEPACFGIKAQRFKPRKEEGPSPATYKVNYRQCAVLHCSKAPFGSSAFRFKEDIEDDEEDIIAETVPDSDAKPTEICPIPTWEFKSKTIRMKSLCKKFDEPSPADFPQPTSKVKRSPELQYEAPFFSSVGRFEPWNDWMPVLGKFKTPGPAYYCTEKPKCLPAVNQGPLVRSPRFPFCSWLTPAPNEYNVGGGLEIILSTHNKRLKDNIENQHKFQWEPPKELRRLTYEEREAELWQKCIRLLDGDALESEPKPIRERVPANISPKEIKSSSPGEIKPKFLRCFL